jgi:hypothetical protein
MFRYSKNFTTRFAGAGILFTGTAAQCDGIFFGREDARTFTFFQLSSIHPIVIGLMIIKPIRYKV